VFEGEGGGAGGLMQADSAALTSAAMEAGNTAEALDQMLRNLMDNLSPLRYDFMGMGGGAFERVRGAIEVHMRELNDALTFLGERVGLSSADYVGVDEEIAETFGAMGVSDDQATRLSDANTSEIGQIVDQNPNPTPAAASQIVEALNTR